MYFYVATDDLRNIVTGVTRSLDGAMRIHKSGRDEQTAATSMVFARSFGSLQEALAYEEYFLRLSTRQRDQLITAVNPTWQDWSDESFPAMAGIAFAESVSEALTKWLNEGSWGSSPGDLAFNPSNSKTESPSAFTSVH